MSDQSRRTRIHVMSIVLAGAVALGGSPVYVRAAEAAGGAQTAASGTEDDLSKSTRVLLPSAGFSYSFSANKVSLRDVEDQLYNSGVITEKKTAGSGKSSGAAQTAKAAASVSSAASAADQESEEQAQAKQEEDNRAISDTSLTPVQKQEQKVIQAVSETQGIEINNATATILSATAVTVVSDAKTAVSLAKLADKRETQAKLDQGVITAGEAEALMATNKASTSISVNVGAESTDDNQAGTSEVVISIDPGTGDGSTAVQGAAPEGSAADAAASGTSDAATGENPDSGASSENAAAEGSTEAAENAVTDGSTGDGTGSTAADEAAEAGTDAAAGTSSSENSGAVATDSKGNELVVAQVNDYINIREDADQDSDIVGKLYNGSVAKVLGRTGNGWARIESGDVKGFIREEYVATGETAQKLADSVSTKHAVVTTETLRVRAAAEADSDVITLIGQGETLDILGEENGWYKISTPDGEGYISSDFADVEETYPEAVSKEQEEAEEAAKKAEEEAAAKAASEEAEKAASESSAKAESSSKSSGSSGSASSDASTETASASTASSESPADSSGSGSGLNTYTGSSSSGTSAGQAVVNYALQFLGNPYVWGGSSLTNGTDCSGFTMAVYANFGYSLPHYTGSQESCGTAVASLADAQPGDLILYDGHVGIYMGNNQIVHASNPRTGITTGTATYRHIVAIRRIIN